MSTMAVESVPEQEQKPESEISTLEEPVEDNKSVTIHAGSDANDGLDISISPSVDSSPIRSDSESKRGGIIRKSSLVEGEQGSPGSLHRGSSSESRRASVSGPSDSLLRTTAARLNERAAWDVQVEEKKVLSTPQPVKKPDPNYVPGERLLKPTQSRLNERRVWEEHLKNKPFEDDIWWEKRGSQLPQASKKIDVPSRLNEPTVAAKQNRREKFPLKKDEGASPSKEHSVSRIDPNSPLLKSTCAYFHQQMDKDGNLLYPPENEYGKPIVLVAKNTGPNVPSKLHCQTRSSIGAVWSPKPVDEKSSSPKKNSKPPSPRLLEFNSAMNAQRREKVVKPPPNEREIGWKQFTHKEKIPTEIRPVSTSPPNSRCRSLNRSSSLEGSGSRKSEDDIDRLTEQVQQQDLEDSEQPVPESEPVDAVPAPETIHEDVAQVELEDVSKVPEDTVVQAGVESVESQDVQLETVASSDALDIGKISASVDEEGDGEDGDATEEVGSPASPTQKKNKRKKKKKSAKA